MMLNTEIRLLAFAKAYAPTGITAMEAGRLMHPTTQQPEKKAKTMLRHMRRMRRAGLLAEIQGPGADRYTSLLFIPTEGADTAPCTFPRLATYEKD